MGPRERRFGSPFHPSRVPLLLFFFPLLLPLLSRFSLVKDTGVRGRVLPLLPLNTVGISEQSETGSTSNGLFLFGSSTPTAYFAFTLGADLILILFLYTDTVKKYPCMAHSHLFPSEFCNN